MPLLLVMTVALALSLAAPTQSYAQSAPPAAHEMDAPLSAAAAQVIHLLDLRVDDGAVELGARLILQHPEDAALHGLYLISLRGYGGWNEALLLSEEYVARWPDDPWVQVARGYLIVDPNRTEEALAAAARARKLAPENADIARYVMSIYSAHRKWEQAVALADSFIDSDRATTELRLEKAGTLSFLARLRSDTAAATLAQRELESALAETPPSAAAFFTAGVRVLWFDRGLADAVALLERAVELSPHSNPIRRAYWDGISTRTDITTDEKRAVLDADVDAWLDARQHAVGARLAVANHFSSLRDYDRFDLMSELIQREHPGTWQAAQVALRRAQREADYAREQAPTLADSMAVDRHLRDMLWAITTMPGANSSVLSSAYGQLFRLLHQDSTTSADEVMSAFERLEEHSPWPPPPTARHVTLPVALAERGSRLDHAEQLARAGLEPLEDDLEWRREWFTVADYAEALDRLKSDYHATIGWVLYHKGEVAEAKRELEKAHEALNTDATPPYRLGRIAEAEGDIEAAERWYATGRGRENWDRNSSEALERLYLARNESLDGFDRYLAAIDERDLARRRAKVESERIAEPELLPDFDHAWMNGGRFNSASLEGKIAVINFWGVWCGPCVREAPEIQEFAEKFRDHPDVVFITVANDIDPQTTRGFMEEKGYDFPVIFDEGIVRMTNVPGFPTTIFVDRDGRIVFSFVGASLQLVNEFTWRVEALLGRTVASSGEESDRR
jgi:thiol-disulfide isomerase/thioredoxin